MEQNAVQNCWKQKVFLTNREDLKNNLTECLIISYFRYTFKHTLNPT